MSINKKDIETISNFAKLMKENKIKARINWDFFDPKQASRNSNYATNCLYDILDLSVTLAIKKAEQGINDFKNAESGKEYEYQHNRNGDVVRYFKKDNGKIAKLVSMYMPDQLPFDDKDDFASYVDHEFEITFDEFLSEIAERNFRKILKVELNKNLDMYLNCFENRRLYSRVFTEYYVSYTTKKEKKHFKDYIQGNRIRKTYPKTWEVNGLNSMDWGSGFEYFYLDDQIKLSMAKTKLYLQNAILKCKGYKTRVNSHLKPIQDTPGYLNGLIEREYNYKGEIIYWGTPFKERLLRYQQYKKMINISVEINKKIEELEKSNINIKSINGKIVLGIDIQNTSAKTFVKPSEKCDDTFEK